MEWKDLGFNTPAPEWIDLVELLTEQEAIAMAKLDLPVLGCGVDTPLVNDTIDQFRSYIKIYTETNTESVLDGLYTRYKSFYFIVR